MKEFLEKHKKKIEDYGTLIPPAYWFLVWIDFTKINLLFIFVLGQEQTLIGTPINLGKIDLRPLLNI